MDERSMYWSSMVQCKYKLSSIEESYRRNISIYRSIKILIAITSSASVAGWTVWNNYGVIWGLLIAFTNVVSVLNEYMPFQKRIESLGEMANKLSALYIDIESDWEKIDVEELNPGRILELRREHMKEWNRISNAGLDSDFVSLPKHTTRKIYEETMIYFNNLYGGTENE